MSNKNNFDTYMYRVRLLVESYKWSENYIVKNQFIHLFKRDQNFNKDLSHIFSNYKNFTEDDAYASTVADELFSEKEVQELKDLFGDITEAQIMIYGRVKLPILYSNNTGIWILPADRRTHYFQFKYIKKEFLPKKLSFPLEGFIRMDDHLVDPRDIEDILSKKDISDEKLRKMLSEL